MSAPAKPLTLSSENQFSFVCPIFNAPTKMAACLQLRELVWAGKRPEVRKGCQACMEAGKCPAALAVQRLSKRASNSALESEDFYGSRVPVEGKLGLELLAQILPVTVQQRTMDRHGVPGPERLAIDGAAPRIEAQMRTAPTTERQSARMNSSGGDPVRKFKSRNHGAAAPAASPAVNSAAAQAAVTGDMSAALNSQDPK